MAEAASKPDYGLDSPAIIKDWWHRAAWFGVIALAVWFVNHEQYPAVSARLLAVLAALGAASAGVARYKIQSSRHGKLRLRDQLLDQLALRGDEKILDVGCGLGLLAIGAAARLKTGKVTAIDSWDPRELSGSSLEAARENAKRAGVADRIRFEAGDPRKLVYPADQYDVVVSFATLHRLADDDERQQSLREMLRVVKPDGKILVFDTFETSYYADVLRSAGARDVELSTRNFLWCLPGRVVSAQKP